MNIENRKINSKGTIKVIVPNSILLSLLLLRHYYIITFITT